MERVRPRRRGPVRSRPATPRRRQRSATLRARQGRRLRRSRHPGDRLQRRGHLAPGHPRRRPRFRAQDRRLSELSGAGRGAGAKGGAHRARVGRVADRAREALVRQRELEAEIAERKIAEKEREKAEEALREADRRKDEFLAMLAHELRNPLAPIRNALEVLKLADVSPELLRQTREMMERQVQVMVRLVDDLLDVSRITRGKIELRKEPIELRTVVARAVETARPLIEARNHQLTVELPPEPLLVEGDVVRLAQVVANLLNNAAKYMRTGRPHRPDGRARGGEAVVRVRDAGIGIAPEMLPQIFDLFTQADDAAVAFAGRPRHRPDAGAATGGDARRQGGGAQRRPRPRQRIRGAPARPGRKAAGRAGSRRRRTDRQVVSAARPCGGRQRRFGGQPGGVVAPLGPRGPGGPQRLAGPRRGPDVPAGRGRCSTSECPT